MRDQGFRTWLYDYRGRKILPIVAYVEFSTFFLSRGKDLNDVRTLMRKLQVQIEPLQGQSADAMALSIVGAGMRPKSGEFYKMWRDHAIAGHAHTAPLTLVTHNLEDFSFLGSRVMSPPEIMRQL